MSQSDPELSQKFKKCKNKQGVQFKKLETGPISSKTGKSAKKSPLRIP